MKRVIYLLTIIAFIGCSLSSTDIGTILENPDTYDGTELTISGTVTEKVNLVLVKYYGVNDGTGTIYIKALTDLPEKGSEVKVRGQVKKVLNFGSDNLTGMIELERK